MVTDALAAAQAASATRYAKDAANYLSRVSMQGVTDVATTASAANYLAEYYIKNNISPGTWTPAKAATGAAIDKALDPTDEWTRLAQLALLAGTAVAGAGVITGLLGAGAAGTAAAGAAGAGAAESAGAAAAASAAAGAAGAGAASAAAAGAGAATGTALTTVTLTGLTESLKGLVGAAGVGAIISGFNLGGFALDTLLSPVINSLKATAPTSPVLAVDVGDNINKVLSGAMNSLVGMTVISEMLSPLKQVGLGYLSAMLFDVAGYRPITGAILGAHVDGALARPMGYYTNQLYRSKVLDWQQARRAYIAGFMSKEQLQQHYAWAGLPEAYYDYLDFSAATDLRPAQLAQLAREGMYDHDFFDREFRHIGYDEVTREKLHVVYSKTQDQYAVEGVKVLARKAYKAGVMPEADFRALLAQAGVPARVQDLEIAATTWDKKTDERNLSVASILGLFTYGVIDYAEALRQLAILGYSETAGKNLIKLEVAKKTAQPKTLTQTQAATAYDKGVIDRVTYDQILVELNYAPFDREVLLQLADLALPKTKTPAAPALV